MRRFITLDRIVQKSCTLLKNARMEMRDTLGPREIMCPIVINFCRCLAKVLLVRFLE